MAEEKDDGKLTTMQDLQQTLLKTLDLKQKLTEINDETKQIHSDNLDIMQKMKQVEWNISRDDASDDYIDFGSEKPFNDKKLLRFVSKKYHTIVYKH
eukprot:414544_1